MMEPTVGIRHFRQSDRGAVWIWASDPIFTRYLTWPAYESLDQLQRHIDEAVTLTSPPNEMWGIELDGQLVGSIHAIERDAGRVQFGFGIAPAVWGKRIAVEACRLALDSIVTTWHPTEFWADVHIENDRAKSVVTKLGFEHQSDIGSIGDDRERWSLSVSDGVEPTTRNDLRHDVLNAFSDSAYSNENVVAAFVAGSTSEDNDGEWSDVDVYLVVDEPDLASVQSDVIRMANEAGNCIGLFPATSTHWFALYENLVVLDIGLVTCVTYRALGARADAILFDRRAGFLNEASPEQTEVAQLALYGVVILTRIASKIEAQDYWLVPRFAAAMRDRVLLPLIRTQGLLKHSFPGQAEISQLPDDIQRLMSATFSEPTELGSKRIFGNSAQILRQLTEQQSLENATVLTALARLEIAMKG